MGIRRHEEMDWINLEAFLLNGSAAYNHLLDEYNSINPDLPAPPSDEFMNFIAHIIKYSDDYLTPEAIMFCEYFFENMWEGYGEYKKLSETLTRVVGPCLQDGTEMIGYKKALSTNPVTNFLVPVIVKLRIPKDAKRSKAFGEKCRCNKATVEDIYRLDPKRTKIKEAFSQFDNSFIYHVGRTVLVSNFNECPWLECARGIHFFENESDAIKYRF